MVVNQNEDSGSCQTGKRGVFDRNGGRKYLNSAERKKLLAVAENEADAPAQAFALTLFYTGCRISEALNLTAERVDFTNRALVLETLKRRSRGHFRAVPIPDALCERLRPLLLDRAGPARVWAFSRATGYRHIKDLMRRAKITGGMMCPKGLRHGMAVACLEQGIPITTVQKWLGHARLETTAIYLDVSGDEERELASRLWAKK